MPIILPPFRCCCCVSCRGAGGPAVSPGGRPPGGGDEGPGGFITGPTGTGPTGGEVSNSGQPLLIPRLSGAPVPGETWGARLRSLQKRNPSPVWVGSYCGVDRDCVPDERLNGTYNEALAAAVAWTRRSPYRFVEIREGRGGALLTQMGPEAVGSPGTLLRADQPLVLRLTDYLTGTLL